MKNFNPEDYKIFECITGSNLYGTNTPESDVDFRGVCQPPLEILLDPFNKFEQKDSGFEEKDRVIYSLDKFMQLCANANPNIIELLFVPNSKIIFKNKTWDRVIRNKDLFLSKKIQHSFSGYAISQGNKIKRHRKWFIDPPKEKPHRKDFGLSDVPRISGEGLWAVSNVAMDLLEPSFRDEVRREIDYFNAKEGWDNYISWKDNRNPFRQSLEDKYGYDSKSASHMFRLFAEAKELLLTGNITFPLSNAEEILAIKNGKYTYEEVLEKATWLDKELINICDQSFLPYSPDKKRISELYLKIILKD